MPAEWLATIISYETGGTFDPVINGPTTKWGMHKGLIQLGEPQAMKYGVSWDDPVGTQLGQNGAVVKYFKEHGWKPGMSFVDAYSVVNAGGPGRYNASDTAAGGAPGTVSDKVAGMRPHFDKAVAFLGGSESDMDPSNRNGFVSAMFAGSAYKTAAEIDAANEGMRTPEATKSTSRDQQRARRSPRYKDFDWSNNNFNDYQASDLLSDPNRDGA